MIELKIRFYLFIFNLACSKKKGFFHRMGIPTQKIQIPISDKVIYYIKRQYWQIYRN